MNTTVASHTRAAIKEARAAARAATKAAKEAQKAAAKAARDAAKAAAEASGRAAKEAARLKLTSLPFRNTGFSRYEGETAPPMSVYELPADSISPHHCQGRRTDSDHQDRRWKPLVYAAIQCKNFPIAGSDLCETCQGHSATESIHWNGRVTGPLPAGSQIGGSEKSAKSVWLTEERPKTRRQVERAEKRRLIADVDIARFVHGEITMDIDRLTLVDNQISTQQLRNAVCLLLDVPTGATKIRGCATRADLCKLIHSLMAAETKTVCLSWECQPGGDLHRIVSFPLAAAAPAATVTVTAELDEAMLVSEEEEAGEAETIVLAELAAEEDEIELVEEEDDGSSLPEVITVAAAEEEEETEEEDELTVLRRSLEARDAEIAALRQKLAAISALIV
jgi:hypothetical protein